MEGHQDRNTASWKDVFFPLPDLRRYVTSCLSGKKTGSLSGRDSRKRRIPEIRDIRIQIIGPVIGAHCGPGTLACCFLGKERSI